MNRRESQHVICVTPRHGWDIGFANGPDDQLDVVCMLIGIPHVPRTFVIALLSLAAGFEIHTVSAAEQLWTRSGPTRILVGSVNFRVLETIQCLP